MNNSPDPVTAEASDRYARHRLLDWWDQDRLARSRIIVAGAGAVGNEVVKLLALMGVNNLVIIDFDRVEISNLSRCVLFRESDIGTYKAAAAGAAARKLNPDTRAISIAGDLEFDVGFGVYRCADVVLGCLDSINARLALNRACIRAGTPWLNAGIEDVFGEVALHNGQDACFECGMTESMWERRNTRFSCGGLRAEMPPERVPTTVTMASIIAGYMVNEALLVLHADRISEKQGMRAGQKLVVSLEPYDFRLVDLTRNSACVAHEQPEKVTLLNSSPAEITPGCLLDIANDEGAVLELGFDLLTCMTCVRCGREEQIFMPLEKTGEQATFCPACESRTCQPTTVSWIDSQSDLAHKPLSELGMPQHQLVAVNGRAGRRYYQLGGDADLIGAR